MTEIEQLQQEVTNLKIENKVYKESHDRFSKVFELSRLGKKIINNDLEILQVNQSLVTLLGYDRKEEIIGTKIFDYAPEDRREDWRFLQEKLWAKLTPSFSIETCLIKKDGSLIWCQVTSILIPEKGRSLGYTIIEDVTEQHKLRLEREGFISVASHEFKTPITSLKATVQLINRKLNGKVDKIPEVIKLGISAERHVTKLMHLVQDLLSTTKIEQGQLALNKTLFTLSDVIDGCCGHIDLGGDYKIVFQGDHSTKVFADQYKIDQVLVNLVNNAVKYAPESKDIIISVEHVEGQTKVSVIDKGPGIDAEDQVRLFERFNRGKKPKNDNSGLGLGLYISSEIIHRHSGKMGVESIIGKGATFWFTLPDPA